MGEEGLEPSRLAAHDPKSCLSASSSTRPGKKIGVLFFEYERPVSRRALFIETILTRLRDSVKDDTDAAIIRVAIIQLIKIQLIKNNLSNLPK